MALKQVVGGQLHDAAMAHIVDFLRAPADSPTSWSTGFGALDDVAQFHPGRIWVVTGVGAAQLLCQWAYDLAVATGLEVSFIGSAAQPESAYRHWFGRNVAAHGHLLGQPPLSTAKLEVVRGDPNHLVDAWLVGDGDAPGVIVAEAAGCSCAVTDWFRPLLRAGRLVIVAVPRECCFEWHPSVGHPIASRGAWSLVADVLLELRPGDHGFVDLTVHENRDGRTGETKARFSPNTGRFHDLSQADLGGLSIPLPGLR